MKMDWLERDSSKLEAKRKQYRNFTRRKLDWTAYASGILDRTEAEVKALREEWKKTRVPESPNLRELKRNFYGLGFSKSEMKRAKALSREIEKEKRERKKVAGRFYDTFFDAPDETLYRADLYDAYDRALTELRRYFEARNSGSFVGRVVWTREGYPPGYARWKGIEVEMGNGKSLALPSLPELADAKYGDLVEISATDTGYKASLRR